MYQYAKKYFYMLNNPIELQTFSKWKRANVMKSLIALSKYLGIYEEFKYRLKSYGIKWSRTNSIEAFLRMLNGCNNNILEWYSKASQVLKSNERLYLKFVLLSGLRRSEAINSFNLIIKLHKENNLNSYYNRELSALEHFRYGELFLRKTKNCYITFLPFSLIEEIAHTKKPITYAMIRKKLQRKRIPTRIKELRDHYATFMVRHGLIKEEVNLLQGRVAPDVFTRYYWSPSFKDLRDRTLKAVRELEQELPLEISNPTLSL